jgi:hypothetical protein
LQLTVIDRPPCLYFIVVSVWWTYRILSQSLQLTLELTSNCNYLPQIALSRRRLRSGAVLGWLLHLFVIQNVVSFLNMLLSRHSPSGPYLLFIMGYESLSIYWTVSKKWQSFLELAIQKFIFFHSGLSSSSIFFDQFLRITNMK